ncbi:MAG: oligosaccharide flippase family protein [Chitinophagaceae bacterium]|nr:oligosaccharide flippase family protein [Chitinophagaceae bacterium]
MKNSFLIKLAGQTITYGFSSIVSRFVGFLLVPFYTYVFSSPEKFGVFTEIYAYTSFFNILYTFGLETAYFRFATKGAGQERIIFSQVMLVIIAIGVTLSTILFVCAADIALFIQYPDKAIYVQFFAIIMLIDSLVSIPFAQLRLQGRAKKFAFLKLFNIGITVFLNVFFLWFCKNISEKKAFVGWEWLLSLWYQADWEVEYVFLANLLANALWIPFFYRQFIKIQISGTAIASLLGYSFPIALMGLVGIANEMLGRILFKYILPHNFYESQTNLYALGVFGACYKISMIMTIGIQGFRYASEPFFFAHHQKQHSGADYNKVMHWFIIVASFLFMFMSVFLPFIGGIFLRKKEYLEGLVIVPFLLLANLFLGIYYNLSFWYKLTDRTYFGFYISLVGIVITLLGNILLVPVLGYLGSAVVMPLNYGILSVISYFLGQKYYRIPYTFGAFAYLLYALVVVVLSSFIAFHWAFHSIWICIYIFWVIKKENLFFSNKQHTL